MKDSMRNGLLLTGDDTREGTLKGPGSAMSSSSCKWTILKCCLVVLCLLGSFLMYYKPDFKFPSYGIYEEASCYSLCWGGNSSSRAPNQNYTSENHRVTWTGYNHTKTIQLRDGDVVEPHDQVLILIWWWPFGYKFGITGCKLTDDRTLYNKAHAVIIHHLDINRELTNMPTEPRPRFQKWVWFNMESPAYSAPIPGLNNLFNLTTSYRLDSDVPVPYGYLVPVESEDKCFKLPTKDKLVCWVVSNWKPQFKRVQFYNELKKHIRIETYGRAFGYNLNDQEFSKLIPRCKFYLSFESSMDRDYITEKLYNPMMMGTVPVVLGPPRTNYEDLIPGDSFIHVDDFSSPKELAERLLYLDQNHTEYMSYFNWTQKFEVKRTYFGRDHVQRSCDYLRMHRDRQAFHDLNKWYWGL